MVYIKFEFSLIENTMIANGKKIKRGAISLISSPFVDGDGE